MSPNLICFDATAPNELSGVPLSSFARTLNLST